MNIYKVLIALVLAAVTFFWWEGRNRDDMTSPEISTEYVDSFSNMNRIEQRQKLEELNNIKDQIPTENSPLPATELEQIAPSPTYSAPEDSNTYDVQETEAEKVERMIRERDRVDVIDIENIDLTPEEQEQVEQALKGDPENGIPSETSRPVLNDSDSEIQNDNQIESAEEP